MGKASDDGAPYWLYIRQKEYELLLDEYSNRGKNWSLVAKSLGIGISTLSKISTRLERYGYSLPGRRPRHAEQAGSGRDDGATPAADGEAEATDAVRGTTDDPS